MGARRSVSLYSLERVDSSPQLSRRAKEKKKGVPTRVSKRDRSYRRWGPSVIEALSLGTGIFKVEKKRELFSFRKPHESVTAAYKVLASGQGFWIRRLRGWLKTLSKRRVQRTGFSGRVRLKCSWKGEGPVKHVLCVLDN